MGNSRILKEFRSKINRIDFVILTKIGSHNDVVLFKVLSGFFRKRRDDETYYKNKNSDEAYRTARLESEKER